MTVKEIREFDTEKLNEKLISARSKLVKLRFSVANRQAKNVRELRFLKQEIARMLTVLGERTKNDELAKK